MPSWAMNRVTAPDSYGTNPLTGCLQSLPILDHINLDVLNQGIFWQLQYLQNPDLSGSGVWNADEVYMTPGSRVIQRANIVGIRIRASIPAAQIPAGSFQAVVTVEAVES